ncbi:MAG: rod shape-determining protein RodA [Candidatus Omnitrophica bacterium]|nr:rod shape-determining protein RodA [Candidatus Omnitrophota bacterium]
MTREFDWTLLGVAFAISIIGVISIYSATHYTGGASLTLPTQMQSNIWIKQLIWMLLGVILAVLVSNINYHRFWDFAWLFYIASIILLVLVLFRGAERSGAKRWLEFGYLSFQPVELVKISIIIILARYFTKQISYHFSQNLYHSNPLILLRTAFIPLGLVLCPFFLIILQPDLGSSVVLFPILFAVLFCTHVSRKFLITLISLGLASLPFLWQILKDYQKQRLLVFLNPDLDPLGAGYTIAQSKIAIGSGKLLGKGWLSGTQNQLNFLPERHTDFIFSIIAEEWGFFGSMLILSLFFLLVWRIIKVILKTNDIFGRIICIGIVALLSFQILVNIAMSSGMMPVVGLPLPFISYGGSSLLLSYLCIGIVLNISKQRIIF